MKKPQWIITGAAVILTILIFSFGRIVPTKSPVQAEQHDEHDGHDHSNTAGALTTDSILNFVRKQLSPEQVTRITFLEQSITRGDVHQQQLDIYHQLSHFYKDSVGFYPGHFWYEAEAARLENSEKSLTFAAHLFLNSLQGETNSGLRQWEALQAKDLFERSLKINPDNDSASVGLGATILFGGITDMPMQALPHFRKVLDKDSTNLYAQMTMVQGSLMSGQIDKAVTRLQSVNRMHPDNLEAQLLLADVYEKMGKKEDAAAWYERSLKYVDRPDAKEEIRKRVAELRKK